jgi:phage FluMu protein Com
MKAPCFKCGMMVDLIRQGKLYVDVGCPKCKIIYRGYSLKYLIRLIHKYQESQGSGNLIVVYDEVCL